MMFALVGVISVFTAVRSWWLLEDVHDDEAGFLVGRTEEEVPCEARVSRLEQCALRWSI